jgi:DNA polymerase elongation subunit (family B)
MTVISLNSEDIFASEDILRKLIERQPIEGVRDYVPGKSLIFPVGFNFNKFDNVLVVIGVTPDNHQRHITLTGMKIFIDVVYPSTWNHMQFMTYCTSKKEYIKFASVEPLSGYKVFDRYEPDTVQAARMYFTSHKSRTDCIDHLATDRFLTTYNDDRNMNDRFIFMHYGINPFSWWVIPGGSTMSSVGVSEIESLARYGIDPQKESHLANPPYNIIGWDIETYEAHSAAVPTFDKTTASIKMYSYCLSRGQRYGGNTSTEWMCVTHMLKSFDIDHFRQRTSELEGPDKIPCDNLIIIRAKDERELLLLHMKIQKYSSPDFDNTFNGGNYDWPWTLRRMHKYGILSEYIRMIDGKSLSATYILDQADRLPALKISAEENAFKVWWYPFRNLTILDTMPIMRKMHKKDEVSFRQSMAHYLEASGLPPKAEMDYVVMHNLFAVDCGDDKLTDFFENGEQVRDGLTQLMIYSFIDAISPNLLLYKRKVFSEAGELCAKAFISLTDAIYRADGRKITNLLAEEAKQNKCLFTWRTTYHPRVNIPFVGALVLHPIKGLHKYRPNPGEIHAGETGGAEEIFPDAQVAVMNSQATPVIAFDFAGLYPNIIREMNLDMSAKITDPSVALRLQLAGVKLNRIEFPNDLPGLLYWTLAESVGTVPTDAAGQARGSIVPRAITRMFNERMLIKKALKEVDKRLAHDAGLSPADEEELGRQRDFLNAKQGAIKIMMNTIYGTYGTSDTIDSPIKDGELARSVTCFGRMALRKVCAFHESQGHRVLYGDTDSTYIQFNGIYDDLFAARLSMTREEYCRALVARTLEYGKSYGDKLNLYIKTFFPHGFVQMALEEVVYPFFQRGKKKYIGIPHTPNDPISFEVNFKKLLTRGLEIIQSGKNKTMIDIHKRFLTELLDIRRDVCEMQALHGALDYLLNNYSWTLDNCAKYVTFKPDKDNKLVKTVFNRTKHLYPDMAPNAGDKFRIVAVQKSMTDLFGRRDLDMNKVGNRMEMYEVAKKYGMQIDKNYYIGKGAGGSLKSYVAFLPKFDTLVGQEDRNSWTKEQHEQLDARLMRMSEKYIMDYIIQRQVASGTYTTPAMAKDYFKRLVAVYPILGMLYKYRWYFEAESIEDYKQALITKTQTRATIGTEDVLDFLDAEDDGPLVDRMSPQDTVGDRRDIHKPVHVPIPIPTSVAYCRAGLDKNLGLISEILDIVGADLNGLSDEIIDARDKRQMSLTIDQNKITPALIKFITLTTECINLTKTLRKMQKN